MDRAVYTYTKREFKKVAPVFGLGVLYVLFIFLSVFLVLRDEYLDKLLSFAYPNNFITVKAGNLFIDTLLSKLQEWHPIVALVFVILLAMQLFRQEKQIGVSDFLRTLPVKEWKKVWIKAGVGELVIIGFALFFGCVGSALNAVMEKDLNEVNSFVIGAEASLNSHENIWQMALLIFLGLSAMFLLLFAAQSCIHNVSAGILAGLGAIYAPYYFMYVGQQFRNIYGGTERVATAFVMHYPSRVESWTDHSDVEGMSNYEVVISDIYWDLFSEKIIFLCIMIGIALVIILLSSKYEWHVLVSANRIVNSRVVTQVILTGISFAVGNGVMYVAGNPSREKMYFMGIVIVSAIVLTVLNGFIYIVGKNRRGA